MNQDTIFIKISSKNEFNFLFNFMFNFIFTKSTFIELGSIR